MPELDSFNENLTMFHRTIENHTVELLQSKQVIIHVGTVIGTSLLGENLRALMNNADPTTGVLAQMSIYYFLYRYYSLKTKGIDKNIG